MNGSRSESVTHSNGHGAANGASEIETSRPKPPKLVDELAQAMGMGQETFERLRPAAAPLNAPPPSQTAATTTLPAMPPPRNFFDDEDDDAAMPIPSTWRNPPEPPRVRGLSDQLRATGLGFATGLAIVVPAVLLMTGHLDNSSFSQLANMLPGSLVVSQDVQRTANETPRVQQRAVTTTTVAPQVVQSPAIVAVAPAPQPVLAAAPVAPAPEPAPVVASIAPAPEPAPAVTFVPTITAVEPPKPPVIAETAPAPTPPPVAEAPPVAAAPAPIASLAPAAPAPVMAPATTGNEIAEGKERFRGGDITGGRNVLARAAASGNAEAIMALAETYDPNMLAAWGIMAAAPDVTTARRLYAKARDSGLEIAGTRLKGLE
jgi:hypothetical protein